MNLLTKLKDSIKNNKTKLAAVALASGVAVSTGLGYMASCDKNNLIPGTSITNPSGDDKGNNSSSGNVDRYANCSESLKKVMTDDYYRNLILTSESYVTSSLHVCHARDDNRYMAIPYGFLEDAGYNVRKIKAGGIKCYSQMYTDQNDLHIELRVSKDGYSDNKGYMKYYTCYDLKYSLTDQELNELDALYTQVNPRNCAYSGAPITYYEGPLFVQELSYHKTPEILSVAHIEEKTTNTAQFAFRRDKITTDYYHYITYKGPTYTNTVNHLTQHTFLSHYNMHSGGKIKKNDKISIITLETLGTAIQIVDNNEVLYSPNSIDDFDLRPQFKDAYNNSFVDVTLYCCQNTDFVRLDEKVLEDLYDQSYNK